MPVSKPSFSAVSSSAAVVPPRLHSVDELGRVAVLRRDALRDRVVGRDRDEAGAEDRVGPGGVDLACRLAVRQPSKRNCRPWLLPIQFSCISRTLSGQSSSAPSPSSSSSANCGDLEEPLVELALLDQRARAPAAAVDHLLVGEHGLVDRVPVDRALPCDRPGPPRRGRGTAPARARSTRGRRWRTRGSSRARSRAASAAPSCWRCWRGSSRRGGRPAPSRRSRPACRTRPSPSGGAPRARSSACSARARRPSCSCARGRCGCAPRDRGTSRARSSCGLSLALSARKQRASSQARCQRPSACDGSKRVLGHRSILPEGQPMRRAAQVARLGQDDVLEPLHGRGLDRRVDPGAALQHLAAGGDAQRVGAQVLVEDRDRDLDPLARVRGIGVPVGHDHPAGAVGLEQRHERQRLEAGAPQVGVDADRGDLRWRRGRPWAARCRPRRRRARRARRPAATTRVRRTVREVAVRLAVMLRETSSRVSLSASRAPAAARASIARCHPVAAGGEPALNSRAARRLWSDCNTSPR